MPHRTAPKIRQRLALYLRLNSEAEDKKGVERVSKREKAAISSKISCKLKVSLVLQYNILEGYYE